MITEAILVYAVIITILFFFTGLRMEESNDKTLQRIEDKIDSIDPEKVYIETDTSPWNLDSVDPVDEHDALEQMWQALCSRGLIGDNADNFRSIFGSDNMNRVPLPDGRLFIWYGDSTPSSLPLLMSQDPFEEDKYELNLLT